MTLSANIKKVGKRGKRTVALLVCWLVLIFSLLISNSISTYVRAGLELCANTVIASVFPFLILTEMISKTSGLEQIRWLRVAFERLFKINGYAVNAFIIGITCGFPIGAKTAVELYKSDKISNEECQRLIGFANNTGPAFIIAGIGAGMRGSATDGIILYVSMVLSALTVGILFGIGKAYKKTMTESANCKYDFSASVKNAASNTLAVCGFVVLFSVICGIFSSIVKNNTISSLLLPFIEVTNAAAHLSRDIFLPDFINLILTSFAISFSGFSVHFQASAFLRETDIKMKMYYFMKFIQGVLSAFFTAILYAII